MHTDHTGKRNLPGAADNTGTIARNSFWSGLEAVFGLLAIFLTSVAVARMVGKDPPGQARLAIYSYIVWLTGVTATIGSFGLPATACKYMAEYLNRGEAGVARATYLSVLKIQSYLAVGVFAFAIGLMMWLVPPGFLMASALLAAAMIPRLVATVPSQANNASEVLRRNTGPAIAGGVATTICTVIALIVAHYHDLGRPAPSGWDLIGLALAFLIGSSLECGLKLISVEKWLRVARSKIGPELRKRMYSYSGQGLLLLLLTIVVWDRSDAVMLQILNPDKRQLLFFSMAFSLTERLLLIPGVFYASFNATMMAQYGRDRERLKEMTVDGARYAFLLSLPLFLGMACMSKPLVLLVYGQGYSPMISTLVIVSLMAIPKALVSPPTVMLQADERQIFLIVWGCACGVVDFGLDFLLVRKYGSRGAAFANGSAQAMAAAGIWIYAWRANRLQLKLAAFGRILLSGLLMAGAAVAFTRYVPGVWGLLGGIAVAVPVWLVALRVTGALTPQDGYRFLSVHHRFPEAVRPFCRWMICWLSRQTPTTV